MPLTNEQRCLWDNDVPKLGRHIVSARAGTGKTTVLTQYCLDLFENWEALGFAPWQGIAMLSYTNVARNELETKIRREHSGFALLQNPHTVQTLDSFINERVFLPFGSKSMGATVARPQLVGAPSRPLAPYDKSYAPFYKGVRSIRTVDAEYYFDKVGYNLNGLVLPYFGKINGNKINYQDSGSTYSMIWSKADGSPSAYQEQIVDFKHRANSDGIASQSDANYFAYKTLLASDRLTRSLIKRFPVIVIDEAQDMTEIQHAMVDHLVSAGHRNIVLVGDSYQSIYEWNTAKPELFENKYSSSSTTWASHEITQTFRNSDEICKTLNSLTGEPGIKPADESYAIKRHYDDKVQIVDWAYNPDDNKTFLAIVRECARVISEKGDAHNNTEKSLAIVMRATKDIERLHSLFQGDNSSPQLDPIRFKSHSCRELLKLLVAIDRGSKYDMVMRYEKLLMSLHNDDTFEQIRLRVQAVVREDDKDAYVSYKKALWHDILALKSTLSSADGKLSSMANIKDLCLRCVEDEGVLSDIADEYAGDKISTRAIDTVSIEKADSPPVYHPDYPDVRLYFSNAHGVKGETHDGVLFIQKHRTNACGCRTNGALSFAIAGHSMDCEEKRIQYVAMSRAAQTLWLAADPKPYSKKRDDISWLSKTGGVLSDMDCLNFGREWRAKCEALGHAEKRISKKLLSCDIVKDNDSLTLYFGLQSKNYFNKYEKAVKTYIDIHFPSIAQVNLVIK